jgi:hypothetical protein
LQVLLPHGALNGICNPSQRSFEHVSPGLVQMPQLGLQQTSPRLQVLRPQRMLIGAVGAPHISCEQRTPGGSQIPQLALQHT